MPSFDEQFMEANGQPIDYKRHKLVRIDRFPVENGELLVCNIEKTNKASGCIQGFCVDITGYAEIDGKIFKQGKGIRLHFWEDGVHYNIKIKVFTKTGNVVIYNVCESVVSYLTNDAVGAPIEKHSKVVDYWIGGAAMIVEPIENGNRYRCSDPSCVDKEDQFGDIVFTVQKLKEPPPPEADNSASFHIPIDAARPNVAENNQVTQKMSAILTNPKIGL
jgi:hypothetical protein